MAEPRRVIILLAAVVATLVPAPSAGAVARAVPYMEGPDVPTAGPADAQVTVFTNERWSFSEGDRTRAVKVPLPPEQPGEPGTWDRIILVYSSRPDGDPWDRLFWVKIGDVEVIRGTTPRAEFTVRRDITEYATLLPPGRRALVTAYLGSWVGALLASVKIEFYEDEPTIHPPAQVAALGLRGTLGGNGSTVERSVLFPDDAPDRATIDIYITGHSPAGEFWYQYGGPPDFHVYADGTQVATLTAMPYVYAFIGIVGGEDDVHPLLWWTAQQGLDAAGAHTGVGEIPPYRAELDAQDLALLRGARTIKVVQQSRRVLSGGSEYWPISVQFLMDGVTDNCIHVENPDQADADGDGVGDACDGPALLDASGVHDGGPLAEGDVVTATYEGPVSCTQATDPAQFTYTDRSGTVTATGIACDETSTVRVTIPNRVLSSAADDGLLRYRESPSPAARLRVGEEEAADFDTEPVAVALGDRPFMTWASALADPTKVDEVSVAYSEPVTCTGGSPEQLSYDTDSGSTPATGVVCNDSATVKVTFPAGTVDRQEPNPILTYVAGSLAIARILDGGGAEAVSPDQFRVSISIP